MTWDVRHGDAVDLLRAMPGNSADVIITDPPYGDTSLAWDDPVAGWLPEAARILKPSGSLWCFGSMRFILTYAAQFSGWKLAQDLVWEKHNGSSSGADRFRRVHEFALHFYRGEWRNIYHSPQYTMDARPKQVRRKKKPPHWGQIGEGIYKSVAGGPRLARSVIRVKSCHGYAVHPTQKPEGIIEPLMLYSCPPGGMVVDPFSGSGTTGAVAIQQGRSFIGLELNLSYVAISRRRIAAADPIGSQESLNFQNAIQQKGK